MEQISLFDVQFEEYKEKLEKEAPKVEDPFYTKFNPCPKCNVYPIERKTQIKTIDGDFDNGTYMKCPVCGYSCHTIYNKYEHWNRCNMYRVRDGKL